MTAESLDAKIDEFAALANRIADERNLLLNALRELLGHCEIAAVMPEAIGRAYVMGMDSEPLEKARAAIAAIEAAA